MLTCLNTLWLFNFKEYKGMRSIKLLFTLIYFLFAGQLFAYTYGTIQNEGGVNFIETHDKGRLLIGGQNGNDAYIIKLDSLFDMEWSVRIGDTTIFESVVAAVELPSLTGYLIAGRNSCEAWLLKINEVGDSVLSEYYFAPNSASCQWSTDLTVCNPNVFTVSVYVDDVGLTNYYDAINIDSSGTIDTINNGCDPVRLVDTDWLIYPGGIVWSGQPIYDTNYVYSFISESAVEVATGLLMVGGTNYFATTHYEFLVVRTDGFDTLWTKHWGNGSLQQILKVSDNNYYVTGSMDSLGNNYSFIASMDSLGNISWSHVFPIENRIAKCKLVGMNNIGIVGNSLDTIISTTDFWYVEFDTLGNQILTGIDNVANAGAQNIIVFPNPTSGAIFVEYKFSGKGQLSLFDLTGRQVLSVEVPGRSGAVSIDSYGLEGVYFLVATDQSTGIISSQKVIIY